MAEFDPVAFGRRVAIKMLSEGMSHRGLETRIGVDAAASHRVCQGKAPSVENFLRLEKWLSGTEAQSRGIKCAKCQEEKPPEAFWRRYDGRLQGYCKECSNNLRMLRHWAKQREKEKEGRTDGQGTGE